MSKPLVTDAASEKQYKEAKAKQLTATERARRDLATLLAMPEGRRVFWALLSDAGLFESIWENSARIHYNAGRQDFGREILFKILDAGEQFYFEMMSENRKDKQ